MRCKYFPKHPKNPSYQFNITLFHYLARHAVEDAAGKIVTSFMQETPFSNFVYKKKQMLKNDIAMHKEFLRCIYNYLQYLKYQQFLRKEKEMYCFASS